MLGLVTPQGPFGADVAACENYTTWARAFLMYWPAHRHTIPVLSTTSQLMTADHDDRWYEARHNAISITQMGIATSLQLAPPVLLHRDHPPTACDARHAPQEVVPCEEHMSTSAQSQSRKTALCRSFLHVGRQNCLGEEIMTESCGHAGSELGVRHATNHCHLRRSHRMRIDVVA